MKIGTLIVTLVAALLLGCTNENSPGPREDTAKSFASPQQVGVLPDGRIVSVVWRSMGERVGVHYIYFVDNTITMNTTEGKARKVVVLIDGVEYAPVLTPEKNEK